MPRLKRQGEGAALSSSIVLEDYGVGGDKLKATRQVIELKELRYLIMAVEAGTFSRVARIMNIKQATLSRHILEFENHLGVALFDRRTRGATLIPNSETISAPPSVS